MSALEDINFVLQKQDERDRFGYKPVSPWQQEANTESNVSPAGNAAGTTSGSEEEQKPSFSIAEYIKQNHPYSEQNMKKKEEETARKKKRDGVMAAIGDGLNAFHQAYAYSRGIKPLTENKSQSKEVRDRYEALDREREANKAAYLNAYIRGLQADEERGNREREYKLKERQQTRLEEDVKIRAAKAEAYANYQSSVVAKNEAQAAYWQAKANALEAGLPLEEAIKKAEEARKLAQARASDAAAAKYGAEQQYKEEQTKQLGQPTTTNVTRQTTDRRGKTQTVNETRTVTKGGGGKPAGGGSGKKPLPGQSQPKTTKKQLP